MKAPQRQTDIYTRSWIIEHGVPIVKSYSGALTLRALHYRLVADHGMTNSQQHYKRVIGAMVKARWDNRVGFDSFIDREREQFGSTEFDQTDVETSADEGKEQVLAWMNSYSKNRWENQPIYPEVWIEKKALQSVFEKPCKNMDVSLCPCKGYPSLTFLHEAAERFKDAESKDKQCVMLYFGDYDPSGEDIPRAIGDTLERMDANVDVRRILLLKKDVIEMKLPPAPTKLTDSRAREWDGLGQVELDAIEPRKLGRIARAAIDEIFGDELHDELLQREEVETEEYKSILKRYVTDL